jgi:protein-disulfide isomerase
MKEKTPWFALFILLLGILIGYGINYYREPDFPEMEEGIPIEMKIPEDSLPATFNDPVAGNRDSSVVMVEYSDYQCEYCKRYFEEIFPEIKENYIDTGKIKYIYKDFPLQIHENSEDAAFSADCAGEQGKYWQMHDLLFEKQEEWSAQTDPIRYFIDYINILDLNEEEFLVCINSNKYIQEVMEDIEEGEKLDTKGTPTFYINNIKISGIYQYKVFKDTIEKELKKNK